MKYPSLVKFALQLVSPMPAFVLAALGLSLTLSYLKGNRLQP
jgi:hypothetical protein